MYYYDTITNEALFAEHASRVDAQSFDTLYQSDTFQHGVSRWDTAHLFASRVICASPGRRLALFDDADFPRSAKGVHDCIDRLVDGPAAGFGDQYEPWIVQRHQPESLGYTWAALARLLHAQGAIAPQVERPQRERPQRERQSVTFQGYTSSADMRVGSSSPSGSATGDSSAESAGGLGWVERISSAPLEDLTVRLASCFIRCVLNYAQPTDMVSPVHFRDERLTSSFSYSPKKQVQATDDGGLQVCRDSEFVQVAMLEGKRAFQQFSIQGKPTVPDKTLGQLVGQALAQRLDRSTGTISQTDRITILAVAHYVKFFNFRTTSEFIKEYETKPLPATHYLRVSSTHWFDLAAIEDRKRVVKHILAMLAWAGKQQGGDGDGDGDESMEG